MPETAPLRVAVVDYGLGNLYSVKQACRQVGLRAGITSSKNDIRDADAVILPGVGAFGDAMETLHRLDLVGPLKDAAASGRPLIGICLGLQLLMTESFEFGRHAGLDLISGPVVKFEEPADSSGRPLKVPQVGWNGIFRKDGSSGPDPWDRGPLEGLPDGEYMYFVHSFYVKPEDEGLVLSRSGYGNVEFCSSLRKGNVFACQFHPERSGRQGLKVYQNLKSHIQEVREGMKG